MSAVLRLTSRWTLVAWTGMGLMFVCLLLALRWSTLFDSHTKDSHPKVLFPVYYALELPLLTVAALSSGLTALRSRRRDGRMLQKHLTLPATPWTERGHWLIPGLASLALLLAWGDYLLIYRPLAALLAAPPLPPAFTWLHTASRWINSSILILTAIAGGAGLIDELPTTPGASVDPSEQRDRE